MAEARPILPCLKDPNWNGSQDSVCRRLDLDVVSSNLPWIAFGYDGAHAFEFLSKSDLESLNKTPEQIEREALRNLRLRKASWETVEARMGFFKKLTIQSCTNDYFASERILDVGFMREVQNRIKAGGLAVGVPRRGVLMVTKADQPPKHLWAFAAGVSAQYHRGETAPITPAVFAMVDGKVVGILEGGSEAGRELVEREREGGGAGVFLTKLTVANAESGREEVHLLVGAMSADELSTALQSAFTETVQTQLSRKEFGGHIRVVVLADLVSQSVRTQLPSIVAHLLAFAEETKLTTASGEPVRITIQEHFSGQGFPAR
jgi:hypothetical protein